MKRFLAPQAAAADAMLTEGDTATVIAAAWLDAHWAEAHGASLRPDGRELIPAAAPALQIQTAGEWTGKLARRRRSYHGRVL